MSAVLKQPVRQLRPMTEEDIDAVLAIERRAYPYPWSGGIFRDCLRVGYCCWVCEQDGQLAGYAVMSVAAGESHILNLCVAPPLQGQGLGRFILRHMLDLARRHGADTMLLEVRPSNYAALKLYADMGFNEVGIRKAYYPAAKGKEDAIVLARSLLDLY
ncbi:MAG: ribosomal protein S18-alanine N-acetyltransferase [Gammaproteobacteria bacterium]|nr:ribosomal protein S18-alanine N-acetyltransferase [Gammaproteobacteria bacterium]